METSSGRDLRVRRPGGRNRRVGHGDRGDRRLAGPEGPGGREGAALRRHDGALRRLALDPRDAARHRAGHPRACRRGARAYLQARGHDPLRCRSASTPSSRTARRRSTSSPARPPCSSTCRPCFPTTTPKRRAASRVAARWSRGPFDGRELGPRIKHLAPPLPELTVFGMMLGSGKEIKHFMRAFKSLESFVYVTKRLSRHFLDVLRHGRGMTLTNGNALAGRLAKAGDGPEHPGLAVVAGAEARRRVRRRGRRDRRSTKASAFASTPSAASCSPAAASRTTSSGASSCSRMRPPARSTTRRRREANTGDGLRLAEAVGGRVDATIPHAAAWVPTSVTTRPDGSKGVMPHFIDRAKPGVIAVTPKGKRFTNEGNSYHDFVQDMVKATQGRAGSLGLAAVRPQGAAQLRPRLRRAVPAADRAPPAAAAT